MKKMTRTIGLILFFSTLVSISQAQINDYFFKASEIKISDNGKGFGVFKSSVSDLSTATIEANEYMTKNHENDRYYKKSIWYKFQIPAGREAKINLVQDSNSNSKDDIRLNIYRNPDKLPGLSKNNHLYASFTEYSSFENKCVRPGIYYIQVLSDSTAEGDIWIHLDLDSSNAAMYDHKKDAFTYISPSTIIPMGCHTTSKEDGNCHPADYTQSFWFTFSTQPESPSFLEIQLFSGRNIKISDCYISLYKGNCTDNSSTLEKIIECNKGWLTEDCGIEKGEYSGQVILKEDFSKEVYVDLKVGQISYRGGADPQNLDSNFTLSRVKSSSTHLVEEGLSCQSRMAQYKCGNVIPNGLPINAKDSYDLHFLVTFTLLESASLDISDRSNSFEKTNELKRYFRLFKGDVSTNCRLEELQGVNKTCLEPGDYTFQFLINEKKGHVTSLGNKIVLNLSFQPILDQPRNLYSNPNKPQNLGKIGLKADSSNHNISIYSSTEHFGNNDTFFRVGNKLLYGRFIYREFYLANPSRLRIKELFHSNIYLVKGRLKNGCTTKMGPKYGQQNLITTNEENWESNCQSLQKGWYSLISYQSSRCKDLSIVRKSKIELILMKTRKSNYNKPYKAHLIQNLEPISWKQGSTSNPTELREKTFKLPTAYSSCTPDNPMYIPSACLDSGKNQASYYVFKLDSPSFITTSPGYLFPYNIKTDSLRLLENGAIISPCNQTRRLYDYYCNLQPGIYTLAISKNENDTSLPFIYISPIPNIPNDYAKNAYDIGDLDSGITSSDGEMISCQVGFSTSDYPILERIDKKDWKSMTNLSPKNTAYSKSYLGNIWYTFTASGGGFINFRPEFITKRWRNERFDIHLYEAPVDADIPFSELQAQNLIDSTEESGLIHMDYTDYFLKTACEAKRYFVLVSFPVISEKETLRPNFRFKLNAHFTTSKTISKEGDFCSNAIPIRLDSNQLKSASCDISCHTMGNSYGENENKLGCLGQTAGRKTTWFKIIYTGKEKTNLRIKLSVSSDINPDQIRYRIIDGSCEGSFVGPCARGIYDSLFVGCVYAGEYLIQVSTSKQSVGVLNLQVQSIPVKHTFCTSFDSLVQPAFFRATGGCTANDTMHFVSIGSEGESIEYFWDFGDGYTSTEPSPSHLYRSTSDYSDSFVVSLTVKNTFSKKTATFEHKVLVFKNLSLTLPDDTALICSDLLHLKTKINFKPSYFIWNSKASHYSRHSLNPYFYTIPTQGTYATLTAFKRNCIIKDSLFISNKRPASEIHFYNLCDNKTLILGTRKDTFPTYRWSSGDTTEQLEITEPGTYNLSFGDHEDCLITDSFHVTKKVSPKIIATTQPTCIGDILEVAPTTLDDDELYYKWLHETNYTSSTIAVDTGWYFLVTNIENCFRLDSFYIDPATFMHPNLTDTIICQDQLKLKVNLEDAVYKWNTGERTQQILITEPGKYNVTVRKDGCQMNQKIKVKRSELLDFKIEDITICDGSEKQITLDSSYQFRWYDGSTSFQRIFKELGTYQVDVMDHLCTLKTTVTVRETHNLYDHLGSDTAVCLPVKIPLLFTHSYDSIWWSTGETGIPVVNIKDTGLFWVKIVRNGCLGIDSIHIDSLRCLQKIYVPNAFTPLGKNPIFLPKGVNVGDFEMKIYNRWSQLLFTTDDIYKGWDGTHHNKDCPPNTYIYLINYKSTFGKSHFVSGRFNLIR